MGAGSAPFSFGQDQFSGACDAQLIGFSVQHYLGKRAATRQGIHVMDRGRVGRVRFKAGYRIHAQGLSKLLDSARLLTFGLAVDVIDDKNTHHCQIPINKVGNIFARTYASGLPLQLV